MGAEPEVEFERPGWVDGGVARGGRPPLRQGAPSLRARLQGALASPLARYFAEGAAWSISGSVAARVLALLGAVLVARVLGAAPYGAYALVLATSAMLQTFTGFGLGETGAKHLAGSRAADAAASGRIVALTALVAAALGTAGAIATAAAAPWMAGAVLSAPELSGSLRLSAALMLFGPVNGAFLGILAGLGRFREMAAATVLGAAASVPLLWLGAREGGVLGGIAGQVVATVLSAAFSGAAVVRATRAIGIPLTLRGVTREWRVLLGYSLPVTLCNALVAPATWATSALIASQPGGHRELGIFTAANQWRNAIVLVATSSGTVLLPLFSRLHDSGRTRDLSRTIWSAFATMAGVCAAMGAGFAALAPVLMRAYGSEFDGAAQVLAILAATGAVAGALQVVVQAIAGAGRMWLGFLLNLGWAGALVLTAAGLRTHGARGLATAHLAAYLVYLAAALGCAAWLGRRSRLRAQGAP